MPEPTKKQIAAGQIRTLRSMRKKLLDMATKWDGVDGYCETVLTELADQCENVATNLVEEEVPK
ncbi:MAG TPA: hypothetical protein VJ576_02705 [Rhodocyclaceae bacterium]|nr:hypothetical protein [Rhodocyclaceae bacterium]